MKIALDAMGGDYAPENVIRGGILAAREFPETEFLLVGDAGKVGEALREIKSPPANISIIHASEVIEMNEKPASALRKKKDSSIQVACKLVAEGRAEAAMSMGNTGASVAASLMILGRLKGVDRPAIAQFFPTLEGACLVLDVGATSNCKAEHLYQFALMGEVYYKLVLNQERPRVGLISIGEEDVKGNDVIREAHSLLDKAKLNFVGQYRGARHPARHSGCCGLRRISGQCASQIRRIAARCDLLHPARAGQPQSLHPFGRFVDETGAPSFQKAV